MNREEVRERVREIYENNGWTLTEHISIDQDTVRSGLLFPRPKKIWVVKTDTNQRGGNQVFEFDDASGELLKHFVLPR